MNIFKLSLAFAAVASVLGTIESVPVQAQIASWKKQLGTTTIDAANGVATDINGNAYVAGMTNSNLAGISINSASNFDIFLAKYDPNGTILWKRQLGTSSREDVYDVAADINGNTYITGETDGSLAAQKQGLDDIFLVKYNSNGQLLWKRQLGTNGVDSPRSVAIDSNGNVYIAGATTGDLASANQGGVDAFVAKYTSNGTLLWKKQLGTNKIEGADDVAVDSNGNVYISGSTFISFQLGSDAWMAKYNSNGTFLWKKQLGTSSRDFSYGLAIGINNSLYVGGSTEGSLGGMNQGSSDAWVAKYSGI
jgi:hypothetical protein